MQYHKIVNRAKKEWHGRNPRIGGLRLYSHADLCSLVDAIPLPKHGDQWGNWRLNLRGEPSLDFDGAFYSKSPYWIRLSELATDDGLVKWLKHLNGKIWFAEKPENAGNFINAVFKLRGMKFDRVPRRSIRRATKWESTPTRSDGSCAA